MIVWHHRFLGWILAVLFGAAFCGVARAQAVCKIDFLLGNFSFSQPAFDCPTPENPQSPTWPGWTWTGAALLTEDDRYQAGVGVMSIEDLYVLPYGLEAFRQNGSLRFNGFDAVLGADPLYFFEPMEPFGGRIRNIGLWEIQTDHSLLRAPTTSWEFINTGTFLKSGGAGVSIVDVTFSNSGRIEAREGRLKFLGDVELAGGAISGVGGGVVEFDNANVATGSSIELSGRMDINGTLALNGTSASSFAQLALSSDATLAGTGSTVLGGGGNYIYATTPSTLTIASGHTVRGGGLIGQDRLGGNAGQLGIVNQGTLMADSPAILTVRSDADLINEGTIQVQSGSTLSVASPAIEQTALDAATVVNGTLIASRLNLRAGSLTGVGTIVGDVFASAGTVDPGNSPGKLSVVGDLTFGPDAVLAVDAEGLTQGLEYDWLSVTGDVVLAGELRIELSYSASVGDSFAFISTSGGTIEGVFDQVFVDGYEVEASYGANSVSFEVTAIIPVPDAPSSALFILGIGLLCLRHRYRTLVPS